MHRTVNYLLIGLGMAMVVAELVLGAATGFDLLLLGIAVATGGALGLYFSSVKVGLFAAGALALAYWVFLRRLVRSRMQKPGLPSNVEALLGRAGVVTVTVSPHQPGQVSLDGEVWRAALEPGAPGPLEPGRTVIVERADGVTLIVRAAQ